MISQTNEHGSVNVSANVYTDIAGTAASNCFGVKGMAARSVKDGVYHLLRKESASKGVYVEFHEDNTITINLHIMVDHGVHLPAVVHRCPQLQLCRQVCMSTGRCRPQQHYKVQTRIHFL